MYTIKQITNFKEYDLFINNEKPNTFLQSKNWGDLNNKIGNKVFYYGIYDIDNKLISTVLIIKISAKRGRFLLVPHGPIVKNSENYFKIINKWKRLFVDLANEEKCSFIRIQPIILKNNSNIELYKNSGFKNAPIHMHTELTSLIDIEKKSEQEILKGMRKTTRQMINKGIRLINQKELKVEFSDKISREMLDIYKNTYKRGGAVPFSDNFVIQEYESFKKDNSAILISILKNKKILSWGMFIFYANRFFYHQGGNILDKQIPNSYLLQWYGILEAKKKGALTYDFWGVSPINKPNHPWKNISLFKRGFGGKDVELLHAQDLIIYKIPYYFNWIVEKFRAWKRKY